METAQKKRHNHYCGAAEDIETGKFSVNDDSSSSSSLFARDTFQKFWFREHRMLRNALFHKDMVQHGQHVIHFTGDKFDVLEACWRKCCERDVLPISNTTMAPNSAIILQIGEVFVGHHLTAHLWELTAPPVPNVLSIVLQLLALDVLQKKEEAKQSKARDYFRNKLDALVLRRDKRP
eukprot:gene11415-11562_t